MVKKKIFFFTSSRSEYGLLSNLIKLFSNLQKYEITILVTGSHLNKIFGFTLKEIRNDFSGKIIKIYINDSDINKIEKNISGLVLKISNIFHKIIPYNIFIIGDRYESFAASIAAYLNNIKISHIHGGETTEGSLDEAFRHSITKMSNLHFVSNDIHRKRVIQLGENPKNVYNVGSLGVEKIKSTKFFIKKELENIFRIFFFKKNILISFHPNTINPKNTLIELNEILKSIKKFPNILFIFTSSNADSGGKKINLEIQKFVKNNKNTFFIKSFGHKYFYSILNNVDAIMGNSSSGIIEAPSLNIKTINIGDRQKGRVSGNTVINVKPIMKEIITSINKIYNKKYNLFSNNKNIYDNGLTSKKIYKIISKVEFEKMKHKKFYNL